MLTIDETDPDAVSGRQTIIRRYLWYEHERAMTESPEDDQTLKNFQTFLKRAGPTTTGRVLPGVGLLHAALLQCFRSRRRGGTNVPAAEKQLAVVQYGSLLQFRGRPYEVPVGCTTKEAKRRAREEIQEAALISAATHRVRRCEREAARRRQECFEKRTP